MSILCLNVSYQVMCQRQVSTVQCPRIEYVRYGWMQDPLPGGVPVLVHLLAGGPRHLLQAHGRQSSRLVTQHFLQVFCFSLIRIRILFRE